MLPEFKMQAVGKPRRYEDCNGELGINFPKYNKDLAGHP